MKQYVVGNWKCHKKSDDAKAWFEAFAEYCSPGDDLEVIVAPSFICLEPVASYLKKLGLKNVRLAAQNVSPFPRGAYTGEIAADMLRGLVDYVIIGHSERKRYFHETDQDVINKVTEVVDAGLIPIVCVDGSSLSSRLASLQDIDVDRMIIAYTPVDALTFKIPESPERVKETLEGEKHRLGKWPVIYGGALLPSNIRDYSSLPVLSGVFVASASLDPGDFAAVCQRI
ncbi:triose-phosphate isomerase [Desulfomarina sp.]